MNPAEGSTERSEELCPKVDTAPNREFPFRNRSPCIGSGGCAKDLALRMRWYGAGHSNHGLGSCISLLNLFNLSAWQQDYLR